MPDKVIHDLRDLTRKQIDAIIAKAEIHGKGAYKDPPLDIDAIKQRADENLDAGSQAKADIYLLIKEVKRLSK